MFQQGWQSNTTRFPIIQIIKHASSERGGVIIAQDINAKKV